MILCRLAKNAAWIGATQLLNYGLPILTLPVVTRAFGPSLYGTLAAISAYSAYAGLAVNYGFGYSGPRMVSNLRCDFPELSKEASAIVGAQIGLSLIAATTFIALLPFIPYAFAQRTVSVVILIQFLGNSIAPQWLFVGLERMRDYVLLQSLFRGVAAGIIISFVRAPSDVFLFVSVNAGAAILNAGCSFLMLTRYGVRWQLPGPRAAISAIRGSTSLFLSTLSINFYTTTNVLVVALVLGPAAGGTFGLADRLCTVVSGFIGPITTAIYPFICGISSRLETHEEAQTKRLLFRSIVAMSALGSMALFCFAPLLVSIAGGDAFDQAVPVLRSMALLPLLGALSNIFGIQTMLPSRMDRELNWVVTSAAFIGVAGMFLSCKLIGLQGAGLAVLAVECFVTFSMAIILQRRINVMTLFLRPL